MPFEVTVLALAALLGAIQLILFAIPANREIDQSWLAGPRDTPMPGTLTPRTARLQRAFQNHVEGLVLFTAAVAVVTLGDASDAVTRALALAYLVARVVYVPCYWSGVAWIRSLVWAIGFFATIGLLMWPLLQAGPE